MIRWVIQMICFDFNDTHHVISGNFSTKLHGRFICHIWLKYGLCITILTFLLYVYSMFHLHLLLPLYSSLMIKYFMKILNIYERILWKLIKDFSPRFTYSQQNCLDQANYVKEFESCLWTVLKGCVRYIFASLFSMSKREHLRNKEKCFLFHFRSSSRSCDNQLLTFSIFKCHDIIKCPSMKHETHIIE